LGVLLLILRSWLYALNLDIDANFRLKNKEKKVKNDVLLGDGWGHIVPQQAYQEYLSKYGYQEEVRHYLLHLFTCIDLPFDSPTCVILIYMLWIMRTRTSLGVTVQVALGLLCVLDMG
jgi:hypothetical protein